MKLLEFLNQLLTNNKTENISFSKFFRNFFVKKISKFLIFRNFHSNYLSHLHVIVDVKTRPFTLKMRFLLNFRLVIFSPLHHPQRDIFLTLGVYFLLTNSSQISYVCLK